MKTSQAPAKVLMYLVFRHYCPADLDMLRPIFSRS
jgi:hypothetical protein